MSPPGPAPAPEVVAAFGGDAAALVPLAGGEGHSWRAGPVVVKPSDGEPLVAWVAEFVASLAPSTAFRVAPPVAAVDGRWVVDGWMATEWVDGRHLSGSWDRILLVSADFHAAAAATTVEPSPAVTQRDDAWAVGDRVAWGEQDPDVRWPAAVGAVLGRLAPLVASAPPERGRQVIHGDLGGNVLFADDLGLPPAVIDISPYVRPAAWADAIVVADAVAWEGAPLALAVGYVARRPDGDEFLARAVIYRIVTAAVRFAHLPARVDAEIQGYAALFPLLRASS